MATTTATADRPGASSLRGVCALLRQVARSWLDDRAPSAGAALSYYTLFSLAPLLLIAISVAGLLFGAEAARGEIFGQLTGLVGPAGALAVQALLDNVNRPADGLWATALGGVLMLVGATTVFAELQDALDRIWRAPNPPRQGLWALLRARVLSFGLVLGLGFLLVVSMLFSAAVAALQAWWAPGQAPLSLWHASLLGAFNQQLSLLLMALLFAMIYKVMPRAHRLGRCVGGRGGHGLADDGRPLADRPVPADQRHRFGFWRGGRLGGGAGVGVLRRPDFLAGR